MYKHVMSVCLLWSMHPATVEPTLTHINCPSSPLPANHPRCLAHYRVATNVMTSGFTSRETGHGPLDISTWTHNWSGGCTNWGRRLELAANWHSEHGLSLYFSKQTQDTLFYRILYMTRHTHRSPLYLVSRRTIWRSTNLILCYVMLCCWDATKLSQEL